MDLSRRQLLGAGLRTAGLALAGSGVALVPGWSAADPTFRPFTAPGRVVKVSHPDPFEGQWLRPRTASEMLERAVTALTGEASARDAWRKLIRPDDVVALKPNGLGGRFLATQKELLDATIEALLGIGVPPTRITIYEQWRPFLRHCRVEAASVPQGVAQRVHLNTDAPAEWTRVASGPTRFVRPLLEATAVINFPLAKDHSIAGVTGCLKNMTHGSIVNPSHFHDHHASPQIAELYAHDAIASRVRLHVLDATRILCNGGPGDAPAFRRRSDSLYVSTDPVAVDSLLVELIESERRGRRLPSLAARGTPAAHVAAAERLGLGIADRARIQVRALTLG